MKKLKLFISIFILISIISTFSIVFAEPVITVPDEELKTGDEFSIGIDTGEPLQNVTFTLQYNSSVFQYINTTTQNVNVTDNNGTLTIVPANSTALQNYSVTITFKVLDASQTTENVILSCSGTNQNGTTVNLTGVKGLYVNDMDLNIDADANANTNTTADIPQNTTQQDNDVEEMPSTGSLNYMLPIIVIIILASAYFVYRRNKNLYK